MVLFILRGAFVLLVTSVAVLYILSFQQEASNIDFITVVMLLSVTLTIAGLIIAADIISRHKKLAALSGVFLGLLAGLLAAYALSFVVDLVGLLTAPVTPFDMPRSTQEFNALGMADKELVRERQSYLNLLQGVKVFIGLITTYVCMSLVLQTKDDFRFVLPYVEFAKQVRGTKPILLDTSVIIDGRIVDIIDTQILQGSLLVPKFVLHELQIIADSADRLKRARGRRGLEILQRLQENSVISVSIDDTAVEGTTVDQKLVSLARLMPARVMTNDYNLNKVATLRGVDVINLNDLAKAMRPVALPGEPMHVRIVKPGEGASQGVGYLDDGTMVVVEGARRMIGREIDLTVTSTLQTSAGRMIFGRYNGGSDDPEHIHVANHGQESSEPESADLDPQDQAAAGRAARNPRRH